LSGLGYQTYLNFGEKKMEIIKTIPLEIAVLIPCDQLDITKK